ncbi:MAG: hypothetical protein ACFFCD_01565 [Promethearchaeota archaeon]
MASKRKKHEDSRPKNECSDLEVHMKYWEFVLAQFIRGVTERITKSLEDWRNVASLDIVKIFIDNVLDEGKPWLKKLIEKLDPLSAWKKEP